MNSTLTKTEEETLKMSATRHAARRIEQALDRHGVAAEARPDNGYVTLDMDVPAANALADWLNREADKQRPIHQ